MPNRLRPLDTLLLGIFLMSLSAAFVWLEEGTRYEESQRRQLNVNLQVSSKGKKKHTFKILQLADMHFGEDSWTDWGNEQDANTFNVLKSVIPAEKPDLIVLSGDQLTANNIDQNATAVYRNICEHLKKYSIPWAMIYGNHDDAPLERPGEEENTIIKTPAKTSREDLYHVDHSFAPLSLTQMGPKELFGTSNYILDVHEPGSDQKVTLQLLFLDTGGGSLPKQLESNQVQWFQNQRKGKPGKDIPMLAFQHIPTKEFTYDGDKCDGLQDDNVDDIEQDPKMVDALVSDGNVQLLAVGHNHGNDYCCSYSKMHLCFGRHSGYGGYGRWERGARIYEVQIKGKSDIVDTEDTDSDEKGPQLKWKSWVRMEDGDIDDEYSPFDDDDEEDGSWWGNW